MKKNVIAITVSLVIVFFVYAAVQLLVPLPYGNKAIEFEIKRGATYRQVVDALAHNGLVRDKWIFFLLGRTTGIDRKIKAGYYSLWGSMSPFQIFTAIKKGRIIEYEITVIPGDSLLEIAGKFTKILPIDLSEFENLCSDSDFLDALGVESHSLEGYLFPDTYRFPKGIDAKEVLSIMVDRLREMYDIGMMSRTLALNLTEHEVLTMASIVEKEAIVDNERAVIAAVYYNRLKKKMPLQADPTAVYGVKASSERITRSDLLRKTPYNTYIIRGLPPGPIASPGIKSIIAALNPADVPYLYFVSNNDGTHNFSRTIIEHEEAVKAYRDKRKTKVQG